MRTCQARAGFTLVELLNVIAIISLLAAITFPVLTGAKGAVQQAVASHGIRALMSGTSMYQADSDESFPVAMYSDSEGTLHTWCATHARDMARDTKQGFLKPYLNGRTNKDPIFFGKPYLGDGSGFGYNWGYLGSDFHIKADYSRFPNCDHPASSTELTNPSTTVVFATSAFFSAPWLTNGDGQTYEFGFIDPPSLWNGNPNVDFRHRGNKKVDVTTRRVVVSGLALVQFADTSVRPLRVEQLRDWMFMRDQDEAIAHNTFANR